MSSELSMEQIHQLLRPVKPKPPQAKTATLQPLPTNQRGPLRVFDKQYDCASRGCGTPTIRKLGGIPYCTVHLLKKMNEMLIELGIEK